MDRSVSLVKFQLGGGFSNRAGRQKVHGTICLSVYLSICRPVYPSIYLSICLSIYLFNCKLDNEDILRDFEEIRKLKAEKIEKQSFFSARLPSNSEVDNIKNAAILQDFLQIWKLATSKTQPFCKTSSVFGIDNIKFEAILRLPSKMEALAGSYQCVLCFFHSICLQHCSCHQKIEEVIRSVAPATQNHTCKPEDLMLQNATLSRNQRPDLPTSLVKMSCVLRLRYDMRLCRSSSNLPSLLLFLKLPQNLHVWLTFGKNPLPLPHRRAIERPKVVQT